jgi:hypothetical protein
MLKMMGFAVIAGCLMIGASAEAQTMKQKSVIKQINEYGKEQSEEMKKSCGCAPPVEYDWKEVANDNDWFVVKRVYETMVSSFEKLCKDADSKKTVCAGLKKVVVKKGEPKPIEFKAGVATIVRMGDTGYTNLDEILENNL